jgi:hypothetical protein
VGSTSCSAHRTAFRATRIYAACIITMEERPVTRSRVIAGIWVVAAAMAVVITVLARLCAPKPTTHEREGRLSRGIRHDF